MITNPLIQVRVNIITKLLNIILDHPIRLVDLIQEIFPMRLVNYITRTNCVLMI